MATSLDAIRTRLSTRLQMLDAAFIRHLKEPSNKRRIDRSAFQEGLVSALWQSWCAFCRSTLIGSAAGIVSGSGQNVTSPYIGRTELEIAYVAKELSLGHSVKKIKALPGSYAEPVWGDLAKANLIANGINSTNQPQLLTAFGAALAINDLQLCRNASAHWNRELLAKINAARVRYSNTRFVHPSDLIFWIDPVTKDFLWRTWVDEMLTVSQAAIV